MSVKSSWFIVLFNSTISLLIFCLVVYPLLKIEYLKSPIIAELFIPFVSFSFVYFGALLLDVYVFITVISSCWIDPFMMIGSALFLLTLFVLKVYLF